MALQLRIGSDHRHLRANAARPGQLSVACFALTRATLEMVTTKSAIQGRVYANDPTAESIGIVAGSRHCSPTAVAKWSCSTPASPAVYAGDLLRRRDRMGDNSISGSQRLRTPMHCARIERGFSKPTRNNCICGHDRSRNQLEAARRKSPRICRRFSGGCGV